MMDRIIREEARLAMLRELALQPDEHLSSAMIERVLKDAYRIARGRGFVHAEMDYLADVGAIRVITVEGTRIAELTERGKRHLERNFVLEGVKRPDREET